MIDGKVIFKIEAEPDHKHKWLCTGDIVKCRFCGETMTGDEYTAMISKVPLEPGTTARDPENVPSETKRGRKPAKK